MAEPMSSDDELARSLVFNRFFPGNIHTDESLWAFGKTRDDDKAHESGLALSLIATEENIHSAGCQIAAAQNAERGEPEPGPKRKYYCGYRKAKVNELPLVGDDYEVSLTIDGEGGNPAHVDVALAYKVDTKHLRAHARTKAGLLLAAAFAPAVPHICECANDDDEHPLVKNGLDCLTTAFADRWPDLNLGTVVRGSHGWSIEAGPPHSETPQLPEGGG
ncbi:hypothetical protein [Novosphingobium kaempferiae]|uniref:hypothetical protein n=1 Tax=Novosphingobium kaempferiae TaxID=2896849 RepID=UPI001E4DF37A|nr:hypothetical protein [Novosphingobium kaempferiae]